MSLLGDGRPTTDEEPREPSEPAKLPEAWPSSDTGVATGSWGALPHVVLAVVVAFCVLGLAWAAYFEIDESARGEGRVITRSQVQVVTNLEGGIISELLVREGDVVRKDQPLVRLDPTRVGGAYRQGEQEIFVLQAKLARLQAEVRQAPLSMPRDVVAGNPTVARQEQTLFEARRAEQSAKQQVLKSQLLQREGEIRELDERSRRLAEQLVLIDRELAITAPLVKRGVVAEVELLRLEREQTTRRLDLEQARLSAPRVDAAAEEIRGKLRDLDQTFRAQAAAELSHAQGELAKLSQQLPALVDRASRTLVRAPMQGVIKSILNKTVGGVIQPGSPIIEMVPVDDVLLVETRFRPADIAFLHPGQKAVVKISAYDYSIFGGLDGVIVHVGADSVVPPQGEPYYIAHIRTRANAIDYGGKKLPIGPGMLASVDVLTGRRSVLHYLTKPINKATERAMTER